MKPKADPWTNKFDKLKPTRLMEGKIGKTEIYNIRNNRSNIIKESKVIKIRKYHKQFYVDKFKYLRQKGHNPSNTQTRKDHQEEMNNINFVFIKETEFEVRKIFPQRKVQVHMAYLMNSTKHKAETIPILYTLFQKIKKEILYNAHCDVVHAC